MREGKLRSKHPQICAWAVQWAPKMCEGVNCKVGISWLIEHHLDQLSWSPFSLLIAALLAYSIPFLHSLMLSIHSTGLRPSHPFSLHLSSFRGNTTLSALTFQMSYFLICLTLITTSSIFLSPTALLTHSLGEVGNTPKLPLPEWVSEGSFQMVQSLRRSAHTNAIIVSHGGDDTLPVFCKLITHNISLSLQGYIRSEIRKPLLYTSHVTQCY